MRVLIIGTSHKQYQLRPLEASRKGSDDFKNFLADCITNHVPAGLAEEMSEEAQKGRTTVLAELAEEHALPHCLCDPNFAERDALKTLNDNDGRREDEWLRRILAFDHFPLMFVCGADHVNSFKKRCEMQTIKAEIVCDDFQSNLSLNERIF
jgi:hypothetical protein